MLQKSMQCFESQCGKAKTFVENDMALGEFHDFLMFLKGSMVDKMVEAHKQEIAFADAQKKAETKTEEVTCSAAA